VATPDSLFKTRRLDRAVTQVSLSGELDLGVAVVLRQSLDDLIRDGQVRLLIDLSDVSFIDSTALGVLLHTSKKLRRRHGRLAVVCPNPAMRNLFELVGHNLLFPVDDSVDQALAHLRPERRRLGASPRHRSGD
jgi:anti-sigma B factor antagonist